MPTDPIDSGCQADDLAKHLLGELTTGKSFDLPALDLSDVNLIVPDPATSDIYGTIDELSPEDLTDRTINGTGLFDGLMQAVNNHIKDQFERGRITGKEYAEAYVALTQSAMSTAAQFLMGQKQAHWQAVLAQKQAQAAEVGVVQARVQLETARIAAIAQRADAETAAVNYALTAMKLATEDKQICALSAQIKQTEYQTDFLLPAQYAQTQKETERQDYELTHLMPKQVTQMDKAIEKTTAEISQTTAQTDQVLYTTSAMLPAQKLGLDKENAIKDYQLGSVLPAQVAGYTADTAGKSYTNDFLLPAQLLSLQEQTEAHRAKTLDTRSDGVTPVAGSVGKQKDLYSQQIDSYQRDAEAKVAKMILDTWVTQKSMDEGLTPPDSLTDVNINAVMTKIRSNLDLS